MHAIAVLPEPINGSSTVSSSRVKKRTSFETSPSEKVAGCDFFKTSRGGACESMTPLSNASSTRLTSARSKTPIITVLV